MKVLFIVVILLILYGVYRYRFRQPVAANAFQVFAEAFVNPMEIRYEDAHGSAPAGVNASPGLTQYKQNAGAPYVNQVFEQGNPQNINPEFKKQPMN